MLVAPRQIPNALFEVRSTYLESHGQRRSKSDLITASKQAKRAGDRVPNGDRDVAANGVIKDHTFVLPVPTHTPDAKSLDAVAHRAHAHRRAIDRVRAEEAATAREQRTAEVPAATDEVAETVEASMDAERLRRCLAGLTELQRESIKLAYYGGYSYPQVARLLGVALGTVKTRIRDGLIRMRDCLEVEW